MIWLAPWCAVDDAARRAGFERELRREICDRHVLANEAVTMIAQRGDTDDVLFQLSDGRVAEVHLTWSPRREEDPRWPATAIFASLELWQIDCMVPLHTWFGEDYD